MAADATEGGAGPAADPAPDPVRFGGRSNFHDLLGLKLVEWREDFARVTVEAGEPHWNRSSVVHGGLMLSMIDQAGAYAGLWCSVPGNVRRAVTLSLTCNFTGQVRQGTLVAESSVTAKGRQIFFTRTEIRDAAGALIAYGQGTHRWRSGSEQVTGVPADTKE